MSAQSERINNERAGFDAGVLKQSSQLRRRFSHVFACPNTERSRTVFREIVAGKTAGRDMLELGCGQGGQTKEYASLSPRRLVAIDIYEKSLETAPKNVQAEFYLMDAHKLEFPDRSFDLVVGRAILHHLNYEHATAEVRRVLKPGGHAVFVEPLRDNPIGKPYGSSRPRPGLRTNCRFLENK